MVMFISWISNLFLSIYIGIAKALLMPDQFFVIVSQGYFLCLIIRDHYHFATNTHFSTISYPPNQRHPLVLKKAALILWSNLPLMFRNNISFEYFWKLPSKASMVDSFLRVLAGLPGSFLKTCFRVATLQRTLLALASVLRNFTVGVISRRYQ